jgi:hypothetical protein
MQHACFGELISVFLGGNRSDTEWYREDLQRRMAGEGAISCKQIGETQC